METIPQKIVEQIWQEQAQMNIFNIQSLVDLVKKEQPILLAFLMATNNDVYNQEERELLLYLGLAVWKMMRSGPQKPPQVTEERLDEIRNKNFEMAEYFVGEPDSTFEDTVRMIFENYNQRYVLEYVLDALFEEDEEDVEIRETSKGYIFLDLKTVIDCLDQ